jgi:hypothetical protein
VVSARGAPELSAPNLGGGAVSTRFSGKPFFAALAVVVPGILMVVGIIDLGGALQPVATLVMLIAAIAVPLLLSEPGGGQA